MSSTQAGMASATSTAAALVKPSASSSRDPASREKPANDTRRAAAEMLCTGQLEMLKASW